LSHINTALKITKFEAPAFAEAASRRQANNQIITNDQISKTENVFVLVIGTYLEFGIWLLEFYQSPFISRSHLILGQ